MDRKEQVKVHSDEAGTTISGAGALDLYNEDFGPAVQDAAFKAENVVVDLRSANFIDTAIVASLAGAALKMNKRGKRLKVLVRAGTHPVRTLKVTGLSDLIDLVEEGT